jgi:hypothetical protein
MVINLNNKPLSILEEPLKLDIRSFLIIKIRKLVFKYKDILDVRKLYLETPASGVVFIDVFPHFTDKKWLKYESFTNKELMNIYRVLEAGNVYGLIEDKIRIKPKIYK